MHILGPLITLLVCGLALTVGGRVERAGAGLVLLAQVVALGTRAVVGWDAVWPVILADLILAAGLLWLAVVSMRAWVLAAIFAVALILIAHSLLLDPGTEPLSPLYRLVIDGLNLVGLSALALGALESRRRRRRVTAGA